MSSDRNRGSSPAAGACTLLTPLTEEIATLWEKAAHLDEVIAQELSRTQGLSIDEARFLVAETERAAGSVESLPAQSVSPTESPSAILILWLPTPERLQ